MSDEHKYDNPVQPDNKYGHTLNLLDKHMGDGAEGGVHLDIACGYGHIAEHLIERFGIQYVGIDIDEGELEHVRARGLEAHAADLSNESAAATLRAILGDRRLASVTFLDGLEHLTNGSFVLAAIGSLVSEHRSLLVISVPNTTHIDLGVKTLLGEWTYTEAGLLDDTHYTLYSQRSLEHAMARAGLTQIGADDVVLAESDQHFPIDHLGLSSETSFGQWVRGIRDSAEPSGLVNQFVWALTASPPRESVGERAADTFLSVVIRTQGRRPQELREALLCLAGQSSRDFEVLVVAHKTTYEEQVAVEKIIADQPRSLREQIRLLLLDHGPRSAPLNLALREAAGRYVAVFDDDDIVMGDWVAEFASAERDHRGRILRAASLRQDTSIMHVRAVPGVRATGAPKAHYARDFYLAQHLANNQSPPISWAFPRSLHVDFGLEYDESMTTTEDWEFLLRAAELAGVTDIARVTSIYRWWVDRESSRTVHSKDEWIQNQAEIERRIDTKPFLLPKGETRRLRKDMRRLKTLETQNTRLTKRVATLEKQLKARAVRGPFLGPVRRRLKLRTRLKRLLGR